MDRFDKLISKKVSQMEQSNADMAWNDFVQFRDSKVAVPQKNGWYLSKISLSIMAVLLLSVGAIVGFEFAQMITASTLLSSNSVAASKVEIRESKNLSKPEIQNTDKQNPNIITQTKQEKSNQNPIDVSKHTSLVKSTQLGVKRPVMPISHGEINKQHESGAQEVTDISLIDNKLTETNNPISVAKTIFTEDFTPATPENVIETNQSMIVDSSSFVESDVPSKTDIVAIQNDKPMVAVAETPNNNSSEFQTSVPTNNATFYIPNSNTESGTVRKGKRMNMKAYMSVFKRYTDISFYSLENSNDLTTEMNGKFTLNPANSGIDNRYSISAGTKGEFIQSKGKFLNMESRDSYIGNSFTILNNKVGVGIAVQNVTDGNLVGLNIYMSSAYKITMAKNSQLRLGFGFSSSSISITNPDAPKSDISQFSFHLGARYMYKTIYAQASLNNFASINAKNDVSSNYSLPTKFQMSFGGRLYLSKTWAFHPQLSMIADSDKNVNIGFTSSFSCQNKWLIGIQTNDFKSVGIHAGLYANRRLSVILKTDLYHSSQSLSSMMETGEVMLKFELGRFKR